MRRKLLLLAVPVAIVGLLAWLFYQGVLRFNYPSHSRYPVRGIDVSHHQGSIDWDRLGADGTAFVLMKATEGADFHDPRFEVNWREAGRLAIPRGAYHYFTFCTPGQLQARNFRDRVPPGDTMLPPAVDVEFSGNCKNWSDIETVRGWLSEFLSEIEREYARKPVLYVTKESYRRIVKDHVSGYPLWIRSLYNRPGFGEEVDWTFWQFADRGHVEGIEGFVDLNVFSGSPGELRALSLQTSQDGEAPQGDGGAPEALAGSSP